MEAKRFFNLMTIFDAMQNEQTGNKSTAKAEPEPLNDGLDPETLTFDGNGKLLVEHYEGFDSPAELTFECVNSFVHSPVDYEELQYLCLRLVSELEKERKKNIEKRD